MDQPNVNMLLPRLQRWYLSQCDGDWEHSWGVKIGTLDNPGWSLKVDLAGTKLEGRVFTPVQRGLEKPESNADWLSCSVENRTFRAAGGPEKLAEMMAIFLNWAESS